MPSSHKRDARFKRVKLRIFKVPAPGNLLPAKSSKIVEKEGFRLEILTRIDRSKHFIRFLKEAIVSHKKLDNDIATVILMNINVTVFLLNHNIISLFKFCFFLRLQDAQHAMEAIMLKQTP